MKRAYSLDLCRTVPAEEIEYSDCIADRVVCEICGNRVFKVVRGIGRDALHYLSHYQAQTEEARRCEARIEERMRTDGHDRDTETRGQALALRVGALGRILDMQDPVRAAIAADISESCKARGFEGRFPSATAAQAMKSTTMRAYRMAAAAAGHHTDVLLGTATPDSDRLLADMADMEESARHDETEASFLWGLTGLLVMMESVPALGSLFDHAAASVAHGDGTTGMARSIVASLLNGREVEDEAVEALGGHAKAAHAARVAICVEMRRLLRTIDKHTPVPTARPIGDMAA